jgi:hypothetical protein
VEEVEGYVRKSAAAAGSGWEWQGRAAKAAAAGGGAMPKWCFVCLLDEASGIGKSLRSRYEVGTK